MWNTFNNLTSGIHNWRRRGHQATHFYTMMAIIVMAIAIEMAIGLVATASWRPKIATQ